MRPWPSPAARVFKQIVRAALSTGVVQAELALDVRLVDPAAVGRGLLVVARRGRSAGAPQQELAAIGARRPWPRQAALRSVEPTFSMPEAALGLARHAPILRVGSAVVGELRLWHENLARAEVRRLAHEAESTLAGEDLRRRLQQSEAHVRVLLATAPDPTLCVDARSGRITEANRRLATLVRRRERDLPHLDLRDLFDLPAAVLPLDLLRKRPRGERLLWTLKRRGEDSVTVAVSASRAPGPPAQWHLSLRDVSEEERARRELLRAKDTLAAIAVAGVQLQAEIEQQQIFAAIGRELSGLGYFSAILMPEPLQAAAAQPTLPAENVAPSGELSLGRGPHHQAEASRAPLWAVVHVASPVGGPQPPPELREARFDPNLFAPLQRAIALCQPTFSWAGSGTQPVRGLGRRAGKAPDGTLWAPLTAEGAVFGALWVSGPALRPADAEGIAAFALQAGMALERARLYAALQRRSQDLEAEVERRTRELTLAVRALREVDRRKDNFMANVSHELRTPLVTILGYTQLVLSGRQGPLTDPQRHSLSTARRNGQKLKDFIDELLDFSRHELTRDSLHREVFPVRRVVDQAAAAIYPKLLERELRLQTRIAAGTPDVFADQERVGQVLNNLLANAERHCQPRGRLWVAAARLGERVRISVSDDGEGIPPEHRDRIFDRLYQVGDRALAREKGAGLGLGLAISKAIVEAHGGRIWIDMRRQRGTRFCFELPAGTFAGR